jgi:hypothetical protein
MKYYIYVSDTKLEMLYGQIPPSLKSQIATEIKIDLKIVSTSFSDKERQSSESKYSKLKVLTDYIEKHVGVNDVDDEEVGQYFKGTLPMRWGPLMNPYSGERTEIVFFGGHTNRRSVALAGSLKHVIGNVESKPTEAASATYYILSVIAKELRPELGDIYLGSPVFGEDKDNEWALNGVSVALGNLQGAVQKVEFLAKTLLQGNAYVSERVLLGTPIYVALAE